MPEYSEKSKARLATCDWELQKLFNEVIKHYDCSVISGHRNKVDQDDAYERGKSKARFPYSRHNSFPSEAVDVVPWPLNWSDKESFIRFAGYVLGVASQMGIKVKWGGDFKDFFDGPHFELIKEQE